MLIVIPYERGNPGLVLLIWIPDQVGDDIKCESPKSISHAVRNSVDKVLENSII